MNKKTPKKSRTGTPPRGASPDIGKSPRTAPGPRRDAPQASRPAAFPRSSAPPVRTTQTATPERATFIPRSAPPYPEAPHSPSPFPFLHPESLALLDKLPKVIDRCMPIRAAHRKDLPDAIQELSALLTTDRGDLGRPYWSVPRLFSAYVRSFLPWNLIRLGRLLRSVSLDLPLDKHPLIVDLGSGPLTFPLALWLHKPELRALPLTIVCADSAPRPMQTGLDIFRALTQEAGASWNIVLLRGSFERALHEVRGKAALITASQVLNELRPKTGEDLEYRMQEAMQGITQVLAPKGEILFVEPGTRLGGKTISLARDALLTEGLLPVAPCPHAEACPMLDSGNNWCHFTFGIQGAPLWLQSQSKSAHLVKHSLSLSWLLARKAHVEYPEDQARIVSDAFPIPGQARKSRYGCSAQGLTLIEAAEYQPSGSLVKLQWPDTPQHDAKSGAVKAKLKL